MTPWWERYPDALVLETAALDAIAHLGYTWKENESAKASGRLVLELELARDGKVLRFTAQYPDAFPYFQPVVYLHGTLLDRHQHPVGKNLCLIGRDGEGWRPGHDTLAELLSEKFPDIQAISAGAMSPDEVSAKEDHVGEPVSSFLNYAPNCAIIVPDQTPPTDVEFGRMTLVTRLAPVGNSEGPSIRGVVQTIADIGQKRLVQFSTSIPSFSSRMAGFWLRLAERPTIDSDMEKRLTELLSAKVPAFAAALRSARRGQYLIAGFVYPDEVSWRSTADDWFFMAIQVKQNAKGNRPQALLAYFIRADWGGEDAWMRRAPTLLPLRRKSALVIGLGSLGSPVAVHLARAGISRLHLVDFDHLQVGNTLRWALGWQYAGLQKTKALSEFLASEYPFTIVNSTEIRLGAPLFPETPFSDYEAICSLVKETDLVIDASANQRVSHFVADLARELGKPYLWLTTTPGGAGGVVGRVVPTRTPGCWHCFQHGLADGTIRQPADTGAIDIQPAGCSQPTFFGAGVDSDEIALLAARLAIATLCGGQADGFPDFEWDVAVGDLNRGGVSIAPEWTPYVLHPNTSCRSCGRA